MPESVATDGLIHTLSKPQDLGNDSYRVLLTMVPPKPRTEGVVLREMLVEQAIPVFKRAFGNFMSWLSRACGA